MSCETVRSANFTGTTIFECNRSSVDLSGGPGAGPNRCWHAQWVGKTTVPTAIVADSCQRGWT